MFDNLKSNGDSSPKQKNNNQIMITAGLSLGIFVVLFLLRDLFPLGKGSVLMIDLHSQYVPLLYRFYDVVTGQKNLFMDFSASGGAYLYADTINEVINPFNYLLLLFGRDRIYLAINVLLALYTTAAAMAACFCLQYIWPKKQVWNVPLSLCYAFSGFVAAQFQIIKWMYPVVLFPLYVIALWRLLQNKKWGVYFILLAYQLMLSLQLGFMALLFTLFGSGFCILYWKSVSKEAGEESKEAHCKVAYALVIGTVVGVMMAMVVLLPNVLQLLNSARGGENQSYLALMKQHGLDDLFERIYQIFHPVLFVTGIFFLWKEWCRKRKEKRALPLALKYLLAWNIFLWITVIAQPSNLVWHLGSYRCFPVRYAYMVLLSGVFLVKQLVVCNEEGSDGSVPEESVLKHKRRSIVLYGITAICVLLDLGATLYFAVPISQGFSSLDISNVPSVAIKVVGILTLLAVACLCVLFAGRKKEQFITMTACVTGMIYFLFVMLPQNYEVRILNESAYKQMTGAYALQEDSQDMLLHREDKTEWPLNATLVSAGRSMTGYFPSGSGKEFASSMEKMGYLTPWVSTRSWGGTVISDALLGIQREGISSDVFASGVLLDKTAKEIKEEFEKLSVAEPLEVQNLISEVLTGEKLFSITDMAELSTDADGNAVIELLQDSILYLDAGMLPTDFLVWINDMAVEIPEDGIAESPDRIFALGRFSFGEVKIKITDKAGYPLILSGKMLGVLDCKTWEKAIAEISNDSSIQMSVDESKGKITVNISDIGDSRTLVLPMAYTDGWRVSHDGKTVDAIPVFGGILGVDVEALDLQSDDVELVFSFVSPGIRIGAILALIGILILLVACLLQRSVAISKWQEKMAEVARRISYLLFVAVFCAGVLVVYVVPNTGLVVNAVIRVLGLETDDNVVEQPPVRVAQMVETEDGIQVDLVNENLMLKKGVRVKADSLENEDFPAEMVKDGITDEDGNRWSSANDWENNEHWLHVDFKEEVPVICVKLFWERTNACEYAVEYSNDKKEWIPLAEFSDSPSQKEQTILLDSPVQTRYLRLHVFDVTKKEEDLSLYYQNVSLAELEVYGSIAGSMLVKRPQIGAGSNRKLELPKVEAGYNLQFDGADYANLIDKDGNIADTLSDVEVELGFILGKDDLTFELPGIKTVIPASEPDNGSMDFAVAEAKTSDDYVRIAPDVSFVIPDADRESAELLQKMADLFADELELNTGAGEVSADVAQIPEIVQVAFVLEEEADNALGEEGCEIRVEEEQISIIANTPSGIRFGCVTLLDLLSDTGKLMEKGTIALGTYRDYPKYDVRGFGIDVGRRAIPLELLYDMVEELSLQKMNTLHVHLNDNQIISSSGYDGTVEGARNLYSGFRLESDIKNEAGVGITSTDHYYTREEFRKFIEDAAVYGISVVPEIDTPAHSLALTKVFPDLGITKDPEAADMLDLSKKEARQLGKDIWSEAVPAFENCQVLHLGMDEYFGNTEDFLLYQEELTNHLSSIAPDKKLRVWGSLTWKNGDMSRISRDLQMQIWDVDWADPVDMYNEGFSIINSLKNELYIIPGSGYDRLNTEYLQNTWQPNVFKTQERTWTLPAWSEKCLGACYVMWNDWAQLNEGTITENDLYERFKEPLEIIADKLW